MPSYPAGNIPRILSFFLSFGVEREKKKDLLLPANKENTGYISQSSVSVAILNLKDLLTFLGTS